MMDDDYELGVNDVYQDKLKRLQNGPLEGWTILVREPYIYGTSEVLALPPFKPSYYQGRHHRQKWYQWHHGNYPQEIKSLVDTYRQNNGYANMDLLEFLVRCLQNG